MTTTTISRRPPRRALPILLAVLAVSIVALLKFRFVVPHSETREIAPGVTLSVATYNRLSGAVKTYVVRAEAAAWRARIVPASDNVLLREPTTAIASALQTPVAVNGGYFAYGGAPVGPLRCAGEWIRLPWKNRTSLGLNGREVKIDNLAATATLEISSGLSLPVAQLNGNAAPNALTVQTRHFPVYKLRSGENALLLKTQNLKGARTLKSGTLRVATGEMAIIAHGTALPQLARLLKAGAASVRLNVAITPPEWERFPDILGAGPRLLRGGVIATTEREEEFKPDVLKRGPRTAFGLDSAGNLLLFVNDGRQMPFEGLTVPELAQDMQRAGAVEALSLDGGNSTTLVVNGELLNSPSSGGEVLVSNVLALQKNSP